MNDNNGLIAITKTSSKGTSLRITLPKEIADKLDIGENQFIGFFHKDGTITIKKIVG
ncbi:MAG: AbrB/MazE/SpoVT family DNA-binding domain-containing protein [Thermoplasmataceae archaeon]